MEWTNLQNNDEGEKFPTPNFLQNWRQGRSV